MIEKAKIGDKYNKLTILQILPNRRVLVACECGKKKEIYWYSVFSGSTKTCGCEQRASRIKYKIGDKHWRLTIKKILSKSKVEAECECGSIKEYHFQNIKKGATKSCGCFCTEIHTKHGSCDHPLYSAWEGMHQRCYNVNSGAYKHYGRKGVTMCPEWENDFVAFFDWALENGWKAGLKIDKDIKAPKIGPAIYGPEYCSVVTQKKNLWSTTRSRVIEYNGEAKCVAEWSDILGIPYNTLIARIKRGWDTERAFRNENFIHNQFKKSA